MLSDIYIEISGRCNGKCPYCARQRFKHRYSGENMSPELFNKILDHLIAIGLISVGCGTTVHLYNWGEPFLNPEFNQILAIIKKNGLYAGISSNFIMKPEIDKDNLLSIHYVTLSLSGFTQESYSKIHGASLNRVLSNFNTFYEQIRTYARAVEINVAWHRYRFNEGELWEAYKYFNRRGIRFNPSIAYFNDLPEMLDYAEDKLSKDREIQAEKDLFLEVISKDVSHYKKKSKHHYCFMWESLVIDENGQLLLCCGIPNEDTAHVLGNVLEMSAEEIWQKKLSDPICNRCILVGLPITRGRHGKKSLPSGDKGDYLKLWCQINLYSIIDRVIRIIKALPLGERLVRIIRKIKDVFSKKYS